MIFRRLFPQLAKLIAAFIICLTNPVRADDLPKTYGDLVGLWKNVEIDSADGKLSKTLLFEKSGNCTFSTTKLSDDDFSVVAGKCKLEGAIIRAYDVSINNGPPDPKQPSGQIVDYSILSYDGSKLKLGEGNETYEVSRFTPRF